MSIHDIEISYPVFYPVRKFYWSPNWIGFALICVSSLFTVLPLGAQFSLLFRTLFASLFLLYFLYRVVAKYSDYQVLKGFIRGEIRLKSEEIQYEGDIIPIESIEKLDFAMLSYEGERVFNPYKGNLNGILSKGVNNSVTIYFKNGDGRKIFYQRKKSDDIESIKPLLIEYCKKGLISFHVLTSIICSSYEEVQELKAKYF